MSVAKVEPDIELWMRAVCAGSEKSLCSKHVIGVEDSGVPFNGVVKPTGRPILVGLPMSKWVRGSKC
jgi:hypothetical protein